MNNLLSRLPKPIGDWRVFSTVVLAIGVVGFIAWHVMTSVFLLEVNVTTRAPVQGTPGGTETVPQWDTLYLPDNADALASFYTSLNYELGTLRAGSATVPRVFVTSLPKDLHEIQQVDERKSLFLRTILPLVLKENERLRGVRQHVLYLKDQQAAGERFSVANRQWLEELYARYRVEPGDLDALIHRVDVVPPSLALAQAVIESGWGTSRFAREGNALFGQWTWDSDDQGIVPEQRPDGANYAIRAFDSLQMAVRNYMRNLNRHWAYKPFRDERARMRARNEPLNGAILAEGMRRYSVRGDSYIRDLRLVISANNLRQLDPVGLAAEGAPTAVSLATTMMPRGAAGVIAVLP